LSWDPVRINYNPLAGEASHDLKLAVENVDKLRNEIETQNIVVGQSYE